MQIGEALKLAGGKGTETSNDTSAKEKDAETPGSNAINTRKCETSFQRKENEVIQESVETRVVNLRKRAEIAKTWNESIGEIPRNKNKLADTLRAYEIIAQALKSEMDRAFRKDCGLEAKAIRFEAKVTTT